MCSPSLRHCCQSAGATMAHAYTAAATATTVAAVDTLHSGH
jgi:hypothetical protein